MATEKNSVIVELYDLSITERKDDRFGRIIVTKSLDETDLVDIAVSRGTELSATTLNSAVEILKGIAIEQIANGASVNFGLGYFRLVVNGVFIGDNAQWDASQHALSIHVTPTAELREIIKGISVEVRGMAAAALAINSVTDVFSGEVNTTLTPGGGANITGSKIRIEGEGEGIGLNLTNKDTGDITTIPMSSILMNDPSKISFVVPPGLVTGTYTLSISTRYSGSGSALKEPRSYTFEYELAVVSA